MNSRKDIKTKANQLATLLLCALPLLSLGFTNSAGAFGSSNKLFHVPARSFAHVASTKNVSPLFVSQSDSPILRDIDGKMKKYEKAKQKIEGKMSKYEKKIQLLQEKKSQYLAGGQLGETPDEKKFSETTARSAVKAMMWRVIAGTVTFITSLSFSGSMSTALKIVGSDFFSKALTMFIGERLMNKSQAGRKTGADSAGRSLAKALIWRIFAICNTLTVSFFLAKDLSIASKIAGSDAVFKTGLMFVYERVWAKIEWGKEYLIEFSI
mmetsp:Transcript_6329/g.9192  ORF Transcript_6329/g.9192 Transcript_6329/m.9192 type:complete len:267 (-) Transcript_6329:214-1014(-)